MQKFTAFSILLSLVVVLATVDVLFHGYLGAPQDKGATPKPVEQVNTEVDSEMDTPDSSVTSDPTHENALEDGTEDPTVELQEAPAESRITGDLLTQAGFVQPVVKDALFSGLIFQIIPFSDGAEADTLQLNFFDGETYVGTFYEMVYLTDTGSFQGYLSLREAAKALTDLGTVNEVNMYGDASFYFNHKSKVKTVHMLALYGNRVIGFEYAQTEHEKMKKLFDILNTLQ